MIFRAAGRKRELGVTLGNVSRVALDLGEWAKVRACCEEAVEIHREVSNKYNEGMQLMGLADAATGEGNFEEADAWLVEALVPLKAINNYQGLAAVHHRRGIAAQLTGKREVAERHYKQAMVDATRGNWAEMHGWVEMWIALLAAQANEAKPARAALKRAHAAIPADQRARHRDARDDRRGRRATARRSGRATGAAELGLADHRDARLTLG